MAFTPEIMPQSIPPLSLPPSDKTVRVRAIDTTTNIVCPTRAFLQNPVAGYDTASMKTMCFMLEHETPQGTEHILFDCGSRKDFWNSAPRTSKMMLGPHMLGLEIQFGVDEILQNAGFDLANLKAIVWSHWHWDHIGDATKFPSAVDLVVGPGFTANFVPGYPENPEGDVLAKDMEGHRVHEPEFSLDIAGFPAHDYFGDGSFYLLDVPGHATAHICGLARTTPDTFVLLGADCCHSSGIFRPTPYAPLPSHIPPNVLDDYYPTQCPCSIFADVHPENNADDKTSETSRTRPFFRIPERGIYAAPADAQQSVDRLQPLDAHPNILVCLSHDNTLFEHLPLYNNDRSKDINDWFASGMKERLRWGFLNELPKGDKPGREPLVDAVYRDGKPSKWDAERGWYDVA